MKEISYKDRNLILRDGISLKSRIWLPNKGGPWPTLLMRQPYGREIASTITYLHPSFWAENGYLVIIQDVRGQGDSEGNFSGFSQETSDTTETHLWVRSLPECNGKLGTYGFSYQGFTQLVAEEGTPPPDCLAPAMTGFDEIDHWSCDGGAYWWHVGLAWGIQLAALQAKRNKDWDAWTKLRSSLETKNYLREGPEILKKYDPNGMAIKWLSQSNKKVKDSSLIHQPSKDWLMKPILLIGGWWDPHLKGILDIYKQSINVGGEPDLHIGPASHLGWWEEVQSIHLNFFNKHLKSSKEIQKGHKVNIWDISNKKWKVKEKLEESNSKNNQYWGLTSKGMACLNLNDGLLKLNTLGSGSVYIVHDPWRPVPSMGGHLSPSPGIVERSELDKRSDVATFTSSKLFRKTNITGIPFLKIKVCADKPGFDLCVALSVINKKNRSTFQLSTGFLRIRGEEAKKIVSREVQLQPISAELKRGEMLRISISASAWPAIGINPGNESEPCGPTKASSEIITLKMNLEEANLQIYPFLFNKDLQKELKSA